MSSCQDRPPIDTGADWSESDFAVPQWQDSSLVKTEIDQAEFITDQNTIIVDLKCKVKTIGSVLLKKDIKPDYCKKVK